MTDSNTLQAEIVPLCQGIKYYSCVDANVLKQDRSQESENSLWENDYHKESVRRRSGFDQSLTSLISCQKFLISTHSY